jgi:DNA-binding response OmpR family regulator
LYVDDEPDIREVALMALGLDAEFEASGCASGMEAVEALQSSKPDLVLLDVMMPVMDGPATLRAIRSHPEGASVPIVFITARTQQAEVDSLMALGAAGVIAKPFDPMTLAARVREHLRP